MNTFKRAAAATLLFATIAAPAFAHGNEGQGNANGNNGNNGRGWGSIMASFRAERQQWEDAWKTKVKDARDEHKEDRKNRKPTQTESNVCLAGVKQNHQVALSAAQKSYGASIEAAKAADRQSIAVATNVRVSAIAAAESAFLSSDKGLIARLISATAKAKANSDFRLASSAAATVQANAKAAAQKALDDAKIKIEGDFKIALDKCVTDSNDVTAPAAISTLSLSGATTTGLTVTWTATGDDGSTGTVASNDLRYSIAPITDANFASATQVSGEPAPTAAGTSQSVTVSGLTQNTIYYFAIKSTDEAGNVSALSNVASMSTIAVDVTAPVAITDLSLSGATSGSAVLSWTAPGDDAAVGTATSYDVRYSTSLITDANFGSATQVSGEPTPTVAGSNQSMSVNALNANTNYFFAVKATDDSSNISALSNVPNITTLP